MSSKVRNCIIPVFVPHEGCPNNCVFCNQHNITGNTESCTPETLKAVLENAKKVSYPAGMKKQLAFYGGSFTAIPIHAQKKLLDTAQLYVDDGFIDSIRFSTRPDAINTEILDFLSSYQISTIELGAQSLDDDVLLKSGRGHTAEDVYNSSALIKQAGYELIIQMMTGLPGDSLEASLNTACKICDIRPDGVRIYPTVIIENTPLYEMWKRGLYTEHTVEDAIAYCSEIVPVFEDHNIPVIRLGLNPTDDLSSGTAAAGAYHPALCELVRSRIMLNKAERLLEGVKPGSEITLYVSPDKISQMTGQHKCNIVKLREKFGLSRVSVKPDISCADRIRLEII